MARFTDSCRCESGSVNTFSHYSNEWCILAVTRTHSSKCGKVLPENDYVNIILKEWSQVEQ